VSGEGDIINLHGTLHPCLLASDRSPSPKKRRFTRGDTRPGPFFFLTLLLVADPRLLPLFVPLLHCIELSLAYETLSKPSSRFVYDSTGGSSRSSIGGDETLQSVLSQVFFEFMDGDFESIRNMISKPFFYLGERMVGFKDAVSMNALANLVLVVPMFQTR